MAGKTGTADTGGPGQEPTAWFVGFGPTADPQYVVVCVIDQAGFGATAAAPVVGTSSATWPPTRSRHRRFPRGVHRAVDQGHRPAHVDHHHDHDPGLVQHHHHVRQQRLRRLGPAARRSSRSSPEDQVLAGAGRSSPETRSSRGRRSGSPPPEERRGGPVGPRMCQEMHSLWPRVEPLLAQVTKPARYIGGELGAQVPEHLDTAVSWLPLPRHLRDRPPQPGSADPLRDPQRAGRCRGRAGLRPVDRHGSGDEDGRSALFSLENHLAAGSFDVLAFNLSAELVYTNVLNLIDLAGVPVQASDRTLDHPLVVAGGHCAFNPEPLADFVDCFVLGDGEEAVTEMNEAMAAFKAEPAGAADGADGGGSPQGDAAPEAGSAAGGLVPSCYEVYYEPEPRARARGPGRAPPRPPSDPCPAWPASPPASPRPPNGSRSGPSPIWPSGPTRNSSWYR